MKFTENKKRVFKSFKTTYCISFVKTTINRISNIELSDLNLLEAMFWTDMLSILSTYTKSV